MFEIKKIMNIKVKNKLYKHKQNISLENIFNANSKLTELKEIN